MRKIKLADIALLLLIFALLVIQFIFPFAESGGKIITSFGGLKYNNLHWSFNYFIFIIAVIFIAIFLFILHLKNKVSYWYDFYLWFFASSGLIIFMVFLQGFIKSGVSPTIKDNTTSSSLSLIVFFCLFFISLAKVLFHYYEEISEAKKKGGISSSHGNILQNENSLYWYLFYILAVIIGQKILGLGGFIGGGLIAFGLHRTLLNDNISKTKKWIYSLLYVVAGVAISFAILFILSSIFNLDVR